MNIVPTQLSRGLAWWVGQRVGRHAPPLVLASGISLRLWRLYAQAWLFCLLFPILTLFQQRPPVLPLLLALAGLAIYAICYTAIMWSHPLRGARRRWSFRPALMLLFSLVALALGLSLAFGSTFLWLLVGVSAMAGVLLPARGAFLAVMILTLLTLASPIGMAGSIGAVDWLHLVPLALLVRGLGLDMVGLVRLASALRAVHAARSELARLAVMEERLRMARDLHDLLGQRLTMMALKSELAGRLISQDPAQAALEMRAVEQAARQALREVRATVAGYRQPTLQNELDAARQLLEAAGIDATIEQTPEALPAAIDAVLAWTVREGVTNVIRHSRARWCRVRIMATDGRAATEITNDRARAPGPDDASPSSGLAGLADRVRAHGGQLIAGRLGDDGFRLLVELPIGSGGAPQQEQRS